MGGCLNNVNGFSGTAAPTPSSLWGASGPAITAFGTQVAGIATKYAAANKNLLDGLFAFRENFRQAQSSPKSYLQDLARRTLIQMANEDTPLAVVDLTPALQLLIQQMTAASANVTASVIAAGAQTAVGAPVGNPALVLSTKDGTGRVVEYANPETITFSCSQDSYTGNATAGQEQMNAVGQAQQGVFGDTGVLDWDWPFGSGVPLPFQLVDAAQSAQGGNGNYTANGNYEVFTNPNLPDNWVSTGGPVSTNVFQGSVAYDGTKSLKFTGTGGTAAKVYQPFNTPSTTGLGTGGSPSVLLPSTQYLVNFWIQVTSTPAAGVLEVSLTDGSDAIISDMQGVANSQFFTKSLTAVSTSWVNVSGALRTPAVLPAVVRLRLRLSTDIDSGKSLYIDRVGLTKAQSFYQGGPQLAGFSGSANVVGGLNPDTWTVALTNTWGLFQKVFERFFAMKSLGLILPSAGSGSVSESLVS